MAALNKFDPRVDSLVMETRTFWDPSVGDLSPEDRQAIGRAIHAAPHLAGKIEYERSHTGFTRVITVTVADIQRLYQEKIQQG